MIWHVRYGVELAPAVFLLSRPRFPIYGEKNHPLIAAPPHGRVLLQLMSARSSIIHHLLAYLQGEREAGLGTIELSEKTALRLRKAAVPSAPQSHRSSRVTSPPRLVQDRRTVYAAPPSAPVREAAPAARVSATSLDDITRLVAACTACELSRSRNRTVPGEGNADQPDILFIGEGPGAEEDAQGRPFVGKAGDLLTKMIEAGMGYHRDEVFIANVVKCRPPGNRVPRPEEMQACLPYLHAQIELIRPKIIIALGKTAVEGLLGKPVAITRIRGQWHEIAGIPMMPTYHPAYLLRSPSRKGEAWSDLKAVLARLGKPPPSRSTTPRPAAGPADA